ncbi:MAG: HNH endonuclease [Bacteroidota bacterium]|nr:HNH endonuclease [Bacteroidota bacterium]MDP4195609.1 HNH endonuclease [Bacteroidota bacterium]
MLMILEKAQIVANKDHKSIRSRYKQFPWPSVIRLNRYVPVSYKKVILTRKNILKRDQYKCVYCGRGDLPLTVDHVIPKARGGEDVWENLVAACVVCNNKKGDKTPEEVNFKMRWKPYKPSHILFMSNSVGKIEDSWKPFLFQ